MDYDFRVKVEIAPIWRLPAKTPMEDIARHSMAQYFMEEAFRLEEHLLTLLRYATSLAIKEVKRDG